MLRWIANVAVRRCVATCMLALTLALALPAHAEDNSLLDVLRKKQVLTDREYERLKRTELSPPQRAELIELLRAKGILTEKDAAKLEVAPGAAAPPPTVTGEETTKRFQTIEQQTEQLSKTPVQIGYEEGFFVRTADGNLALRFNGRVASNFFFFEPDTTQTDTATIDRGRLSIEATVYKYFRMRLENDFSSSSGLRDAWLAFNYMPEFNVQIGQYKVPFSYEELLSKRYIDFVERAAVVNSTVNPSRDIGVMLYGGFFNKLLQYQLAGMNGAGQNTKDNNGDKDVIARLVVAPFINGGPGHLLGFNVGGAVTYGHQPLQTTGSIGGATETGFTYFPTVNTHGARLREGGHMAWLDGPYSLSSEYIHTQEARTGAAGVSLPDLDTDGAYVGGTWMLTGETKPFNARVRPAQPLLGANNPGWGAWEAALRYEFFKLDHAADTPTASTVDNRYDALVAGLNWYPNEFLRFSLNYLYGSFDKQGTGQSPNPKQRSNNAVLGRAQFEF